MINLKVLLLTLVLLIAPIFVKTVDAATLETLQVTSLNPDPTMSTTVLEIGKTYLIEATGIYTFAPGDRVADAEFAYNPDTNSWHEDFGNIYEQYVLDLIINGEPQDWLGSINGEEFYPHTFSPNHTYRVYIEGKGEPLSFYIHDRSYDWNEGYVSVTINSVLPTNKSECKNHGWKVFSEIFKNQGSCLKSII